MRRRGVWPVVLLALALALASLTLVGSAGSAPPPQATCSPGPADCFAWHTSNVTVKWDTASCASVTITSDTAGTPVSCSASDGSVTTTVNVRRDASPPSVSASPSRGPDANGWYNHGLDVAFSGGDGVSGISSCSSG